nr:glutathione S-transferase family protein [Neorhizobium tomejilense]
MSVGEHKSRGYLAANPSGRAPTLVTDEGVPITDSAAIVEYLEELFPEKPMIGTDAISRDKLRAIERLGTDLVARSQLWLWKRHPSLSRQGAIPIAGRCLQGGIFA